MLYKQPDTLCLTQGVKNVSKSSFMQPSSDDKQSYSDSNVCTELGFIECTIMPNRNNYLLVIVLCQPPRRN